MEELKNLNNSDERELDDSELKTITGGYSSQGALWSVILSNNPAAYDGQIPHSPSDIEIGNVTTKAK